jgi:outer membrane lipoprotein-sorting protein
MKSFSDKTQILWVGKNNRLLKFVSLNESDKEIYHINYEDYSLESPVPGRVTISMADGITSISVRYKELKIEKITTPAIFDLEIPADAKLILLE